MSRPSIRRPLGRAIPATLALGLLVSPLAATWSIIIVDTRTKEVAMGSATCLTSFDLRVGTPVIIVGKGGATAQSFVDNTGRNRLLIFNEFKKGTAPDQILKLLANQDPGHQTRQYGIVDTQGLASTFSGTGAGAWAGGMTGKIGTLVYAVQGNVLTGAPVVQKAVDALRTTPGDVATKMMAAMEAAYAMGGDGRCSCGSNPTGCGSPPPSFRKSAHIGYMLIARQGDKDGVCNTSVGCGSGDYYMALNVANQSSGAADPVRQLRLLYDYHRISWRGRPDHHRSIAELDTPGLPADGKTTALATVRLRDWEDRPVTRTATLRVTLDPSSTASVQIGSVTAQGNGVYTFPVSAGSKSGIAKLAIEADDGVRKVLLSPRMDIRVSSDPLWASRAALGAATGGTTDFVMQPGMRSASRLYVLLASNSGSTPGIRIHANLVIPINPDTFFQAFINLANRPPLTVRTIGAFDSQGWASASFGIPANALLPLKGTDLTFAFATLNAIDFASNPVVVGVK